MVKISSMVFLIPLVFASNCLKNPWLLVRINVLFQKISIPYPSGNSSFYSYFCLSIWAFETLLALEISNSVGMDIFWNHTIWRDVWVLYSVMSLFITILNTDSCFMFRLKHSMWVLSRECYFSLKRKWQKIKKWG